MTLESAQKAIRRGAIAGFIVSAFFFAVVSIAIWKPTTSLVYWLGNTAEWDDPWLYSIPALLFALSFSVLKKSRLCAVLILYFYLLITIIYVVYVVENFIQYTKSPEFIIQILVLFPFMVVPPYFMAMAVRGAFAYHRVRRDLDPAYRPIKRARYLLLVPIAMLGIAFAAASTWAVYVEIVRTLGETVQAKAPIWGASGWYTLTPPSGVWVRVKPGTLQAGTDLELYGATTTTWVTVLLECRPNYSLDYLVENRRNHLIARESIQSISEERQIMPDVLLPVSYARYSGGNPGAGKQSIYWVATVVTDTFYVEVIASTASGSGQVGQIENLVKSLRLLQDADRPCDAS